MRFPRRCDKDLRSPSAQRMGDKRTHDGEVAFWLLASRIRPFGHVLVRVERLESHRVERHDPPEAMRDAESVGLRRGIEGSELIDTVGLIQ